MRLIDKAISDLILLPILHRQLLPQVRKLLFGWSALVDDVSVPACIVVDIDDAGRLGLEAVLHQLVEDGEVVGDEVGAGGRHEVLPAYGEAVRIEAVSAGVMRHLLHAVAAAIGNAF